MCKIFTFNKKPLYKKSLRDYKVFLKESLTIMKLKCLIYCCGFLLLVACSSKPKDDPPLPPPAPPPVVSDTDRETDQQDHPPTPPSDEDDSSKYDIPTLNRLEFKELNLQELSPEQISQIPTMHIPFLKRRRGQMYHFTTEQIQALTPEQVKALTTAQIFYNIKDFTPEQISHFTAHQINENNASFLKEDLRDSQLHLLNPRQIKTLGNGFFTKERLLFFTDKLNPEEFYDFIYHETDDLLTAKDLALIPEEHLKVLRQKLPVKIPALEMENVDITKVTPAQIPEFNLYHINAFTKEHIEALTTEQIQNFTPEQLSTFNWDQWGVLNKKQIQAFTKEQIQSQSMDSDFSRLAQKFSVEQMGFLTKEQIRELSVGEWAWATMVHFANSNFRGIRPEYVKEIEPEVIKEIPYMCRYKYLTSEEMAEFKKDYEARQVPEKEWIRPDEFAHTTPEQMKHLTPEQVAALDIMRCSQNSIYALTEEQVPFLTLDQIYTLSALPNPKLLSPQQIRFVTVSQIRKLSLNMLSAEHLQNIRPEVFSQMRSFHANRRVVDGRVEETDQYFPQIHTLKTEMIPFLTEAQIQHLSLDQTADLSEEQIQAFTPEQARVFSEKQMLVLSEEARNILNTKRNL